MMIDKNLLGRNALSAKHSIESRKNLGLTWAYSLENFFTQDMLTKIKTEFDITKHWDKVDTQTQSVRQLMPWKNDSVVEEAHIIFDNCSELVSDIFKRKVSFSSVNFWKDGAGYTIGPHLDNDRISIAIQIYIGDTGFGTELYKDSILYTKLPWVENTGYILNNIETSFHGMSTPGPERTSIYGIFHDSV